MDLTFFLDLRKSLSLNELTHVIKEPTPRYYILRAPGCLILHDKDVHRYKTITKTVCINTAMGLHCSYKQS